ncbi:WYL domain-containing protein [Lentisphaera profundi]|uniref:WYL domain-containing protein n=1 Tax=Lentisphaera profundi TaxID=1658616 RepID=A0ABY7VZV7_9BACT|nr:WYL domain-containing protein [Lentisphaera profundi]WDE97543.1 WYL domain-containing protein [Lentisphaera profundi]
MKVYKNKIIRMQRFLNLLRKEAYPNTQSFRRDLADSDEAKNESYAVSTKTIGREIKFLQEEYNAPIHYDDSELGYYLTDPTWQLPFQTPDQDELFTDLFALRIANKSMPAPLRDTLECLEEVQQAALSGSPEALDAMSSLISKDPRLPEISPEVYDAVLKAWQGSQQLEITYRGSTGHKSQRLVDPHALYLGNDSWYIHAYCYKAEDFRSFALHRISKVTVTKKYFKKDQAVISKLKSSSPFSYHMAKDIVIIASANVAHMIAERDWFPGQINEYLENGHLQIRYPSAAEDIIVSWVLSYGGDLQLIAPPSAVNNLKLKLTKLTDMY